MTTPGATPPEAISRRTCSGSQPQHEWVGFQMEGSGGRLAAPATHAVGRRRQRLRRFRQLLPSTRGGRGSSSRGGAHCCQGKTMPFALFPPRHCLPCPGTPVSSTCQPSLPQPSPATPVSSTCQPSPSLPQPSLPSPALSPPALPTAPGTQPSPSLPSPSPAPRAPAAAPPRAPPGSGARAAAPSWPAAPPRPWPQTAAGAACAGRGVQC